MRAPRCARARILTTELIARARHEVQHPAIVDGGAQRLALIDDHFAKEDQILFPMGRNLFDEAHLQRIGRDMQDHDMREAQRDAAPRSQ